MKRLVFLMAYCAVSIALTVGAANQLSPYQQDSVARAQAEAVTNIVNGVVQQLPFIPHPVAAAGYAIATAIIGVFFYIRGRKHGAAQ